MTISTLTLAERRKRSAQRAESKAHHMASIGMMKCDCANVAVKMSSTGPVCKRCADIEHRKSNCFAKELSGSDQGVRQSEYVCFGGSGKKTTHGNHD